MDPILFKATVETPEGAINFSCLAHYSNDVHDRLIDREFYENVGTGVPVGEHFEMEVTEPAVKPKDTHIHVNPHTNRQFVCWTGRLPTEAAAWKIFLLWCVGTAYTLVKKANFIPLANKPLNEFLALMDHDHGIRLGRTNKTD